MDGIIAIIVIIAALSKVINSAKSVKKNAPGQAAPRRMKPADPDDLAERAAKTTVSRKATSVQPTVQPIQPTVKPVSPDAAPAAGTFWQQISEVLREAREDAEPKSAGHEAAGKMPEGDSRECEHGSIGGSMAYEAHQEGRERKKKPESDRRNEWEEGSLYRPALNAAEMRRAVVMAEILKRPGERMAEQARRWSVR